MDHTAWMIALFLVTAVVYSSVGFGGGSTYLALLVLFQVPYFLLPQIALVCNIVVVCGSLYHYGRAGHFSFKKFPPFVALSVPMAYLGGLIPVSKTVFLLLLASSLGIAGLRLLFINQPRVSAAAASPSLTWPLGLATGAVLGFISGIIGIGGGIFMAPLLYLMQWGSARQIAALCSFFILVNSLGGLSGQITKTGLIEEYYFLIPLVIAVFVGGQVGSLLSVKGLSALHLQRATAVLVLFVSVRIFMRVFL